MTRPVTEGLRAALERERLRQPRLAETRLVELSPMAEHRASLPAYDRRSPEEILSYEEYLRRRTVSTTGSPPSS